MASPSAVFHATPRLLLPLRAGRWLAQHTGPYLGLLGGYILQMSGDIIESTFGRKLLPFGDPLLR